MHLRDFHPSQLARGQKAHFWLEVVALADNHRLQLPVLAVRGAEPGPTLVVFGAVYGDAPEGPLAIRQVWQQLNPAELRGTYLAVPIANPPAWAASQGVSPLDGANLARIFPGNPDGSVSYRLAHGLRETFIARADFFLDLHSAGLAYDMPVLAGYLQQDNALGRASRAAALAFGAPVVWGHPAVAPGRTLSAAMELGVPWLYTQGSGGGRVSPAALSAYANGQRNLMQHLGMLAGTPVTAPPTHDLVSDGNMDRQNNASHGGLFVARVGVLDKVRQGQVVGQVLDVAGEPLEDIRADRDGYVVRLRRLPKVLPGEMLVAVASPHAL